MGLLKAIELPNGITVNYHRVVSVNNITNQTSIIEVASYTSKAKREEEKEKIEKGEPMDIYIYSMYIQKEYDKELNVDTAYVYLKTLPEFAGAEDD